MFLSLIAGIVLGGLTVLFALQNVDYVTITFFAWQTTIPLAVVLMTALFSGIAVALLVLAPSLIRDQLRLNEIKQDKREVEEELAQHRFAKKRLPKGPELGASSEQYVPHSQRDAFA